MNSWDRIKFSVAFILSILGGTAAAVFILSTVITAPKGFFSW